MSSDNALASQIERFVAWTNSQQSKITMSSSSRKTVYISVIEVLYGIWLLCLVDFFTAYRKLKEASAMSALLNYPAAIQQIVQTRNGRNWVQEDSL